MLFRSYTGASSLLHVAIDGGNTLLVIHDGEMPAPDTEVGLTIAPERLHFFDANGKAVRG